MIYDKWDMVIVPFPFIDSPLSKSRPALVISSSNFNASNQHTVMAMITTSAHRTWKDDVPLSIIEGTGLKSHSILRPKIFTIDNRIINRKIGKIHPVDKKRVKDTWKEYIL